MRNQLLYVLFAVLLLSTTAHGAVPRIVYNGDTLLLTDEFKRSQCGTIRTKQLMPEISGIACSRTTPGYIWMESDDISSRIVATTEKGDSCYLNLSLTLSPARWDWEDLCGGVYEGKNYLFIGAIGDNNETEGDYYIHYFEEPEIPEKAGTRTRITANSIKFQYPEGKKHNAEAIMYDNIEQTLYIITKVYYDVCQVFCLPMSLDYGTELQTLTYVCDLGVKTDLGEDGKHGFHLVTAADVSPDGQRVIIKNHNNNLPNLSVLLLWEREGAESLRETLKRRPLQVNAYKEEWQGEAVCWLDSTTFYTTSDDDGEPPIYKYTNQYASAVEDVQATTEYGSSLVFHEGNLYIRKGEQYYSLRGEMLTVLP